MKKSKVISLLKSACIAIGYREVGEETPWYVGGTGFFIDPEGFVLTASHVINNINDRIKKKEIEQLKEGKKVKLEAAVFWFDLKTNPIRFESKSISAKFFYSDWIENNPGPLDPDVVVCRISGKFGNLPYLKIKKPIVLQIYEEIFMCGYPGGYQTFNVINLEKQGIKTSPLIQVGRISGLMPTDNTKKPFGIQTDIVGTGGSSGSPIVDANDGEVIGIAQNVVSVGVVDDDGKSLGSSNIGLVWGVSNFRIYSFCIRLLQGVKKRLDEFGKVKPNEIIPANLELL